ncbi:hypothetical protein L6270_00555 [Candidatus Parcubacteria bacterium]|nr:hypothetical protein [Patescibacteria group bacterium]MBU4309640.1 hypothetical protein [Patescibacteria group bacterium]MBU4432721.1 hypothetical protein [Patescibacteria group bacterium]MBU4577972.1 hypothetical protein [Patescibacteria group bacterium]MCG2696519.1 hypothetical protein [Candidatus Parcubacteria bacterium]
MHPGLINRTYPVKKTEKGYIIKGKISSKLEPQYLAINPNNGELFLLLINLEFSENRKQGADKPSKERYFYKDNGGLFAILKGNEVTGLRFGNVTDADSCPYCWNVYFTTQDGVSGVMISPDPDQMTKLRPRFQKKEPGSKAEVLKTVPYRIID